MGHIVRATVRGIVRLNRKLTRIQKLQRQETKRKVGESVVDWIRQEGFNKSRNPNTGERWTPLKSRKGTPLVNEGDLRDSIHFRLTNVGVAIKSDHPGARVHDKGATIVPKRARMLRFMIGDTVVYAHKVEIPQRAFMPRYPMARSLRDRINARVSRWYVGEWKD